MKEKTMNEIRRKPKEWEESVGEAFQKITDEMNRKLKFHGIFETDNLIVIDKNKFVVISREHWESQPKFHVSLGAKPTSEGKLLKALEKWFEKAKKKVNHTTNWRENHEA